MTPSEREDADQLDRMKDKMARMQNVINWVARASSVRVMSDSRAYFVGAAMPEARALDDGAPLRLMEG